MRIEQAHLLYLTAVLATAFFEEAGAFNNDVDAHCPPGQVGRVAFGQHF